MSPRLRSLVVAALMFVAPLFVIPTVAFAQTDDQQVPQAAQPGANLFHYTYSPFLSAAPAADAAASPRFAKSEGFGIGVKGGPLFNSLSADNISYSKRNGFEFGIWFGGNRGGRVGVMGEILYAKKGAAQNGVNTDVYYLEIPILLRINIGSESKNGLSFYILAGEVNDIKLKAKLNGVDIGSQFASYDLGLLGGAGIEFARFLIEVRETFGLRNLAKVDNQQALGNPKQKSFAILVGFRFN